MKNIIADFTLKKCEMLRLKGLTQWDYGRVLEVRMNDMPRIFEAHFSYEGFDDSLVIEVSTENNIAIIPIPNIITTQNKDATCWIYYENEDCGMTYKTVILQIAPRKKPHDYVYTETEVFNYRIFKKELESKIAMAGKVKTVNGAEPDEAGNIELETASSWNDLEDKPFEYKVEETELYRGTLDNGFTNYTDLGLVEGNTYRVICGNEEYERVCTTFEENGNKYKVIGNKSLYFTAEDTGEPFLIRAIFTEWVADFADNDEAEVAIYEQNITLKTLDEKFIPNHEHSWNDLKDKPFEQLVEEIELYSGTLKNMDNFDTALGLVAGNTYFVVYNNEEYELVCIDDNYGNIMLGNKSLYSGDGDTGEPFLIRGITAYDEWIFHLKDGASITEVTIFEKSTVIKTLDEAFIPNHEHSWNDLNDKPFYDTLESTEIISGTYESYYASKSETYIINVDDVTMDASSIKNAKVIYDGVEYNLNPIIIDYSYSGYSISMIFVGNTALDPSSYGTLEEFGVDIVDSGEPFFYAYIDGTVSIAVNDTEPTSHTIAVYAESGELKQLDEKYIPDTIPKVQTATVGQAIVVKAVDENGKPTEWEAVDMASGSSGGGIFYVKVYFDDDDLPITDNTLEEVKAALDAGNIIVAKYSGRFYYLSGYSLGAVSGFIKLEQLNNAEISEPWIRIEWKNGVATVTGISF